jgi:hypothetical protein
MKNKKIFFLEERKKKRLLKTTFGVYAGSGQAQNIEGQI